MLKKILLQGEQKKVLFLPAKNPIQIKGVAGSGKTTVALYRAKHLVETQSNLFSDPKIAIFTFNKQLAQYIRAVRPFIGGGYQKDSDEFEQRSQDGLNVVVTNFHSWAFSFMEERGYKLREEVFVDGRKVVNWKTITYQRNEIIEFAKVQHSDLEISKKSTTFFAEEITWMKGQMLPNLQSYLDAPRVGRGTTDRVTEKGKTEIWVIYESYNARLKALKKIDFDTYAIVVWNLIKKMDDFAPPFTHIIIDEAQDLSKAQMMVISKLVSPETNSISVIADAAQRIYKSGFTWAQVGIEVRGRTIEFKINYRNTIEIALAAASLLSRETDKSEFTELKNPVRSGSKPIIGHFSSGHDQLTKVIEIIKNTREQAEDDSIVILSRTSFGHKDLSNILSENGIDSEIIKEYVNYLNNYVKICTMPSVKGLEFDHVIILDLNEDIIPYPPGFNEANDEFHISTERRLLYTCMTRARQSLYLFSSGEPSRYLSEIDSELVDIKIWQ